MSGEASLPVSPCDERLPEGSQCLGAAACARSSPRAWSSCAPVDTRRRPAHPRWQRVKRRERTPLNQQTRVVIRQDVLILPRHHPRRRVCPSRLCLRTTSSSSLSLNFLMATTALFSLFRHLSTTPYAPSPTTPSTSYLFIDDPSTTGIQSRA